ncbi:MAG TPA: UDP-N-acetylmuramate dehydrogenase [Acidimicrobiia bacterium]|nr:UDP-N-acetylmuramate dehydrogenase [Acidimicrobiia bacterium]
MLADAARALRDRLGDAVTCDAPIAELTTYRLGGPAAVLVRVGDLDALAAVAEVVHGRAVPVLVVGRGSNLLVAEHGYAGVVLVLDAGFAHVDVESDDVVSAGAAVPLPVLARRSAAAGRAGLEFYVGIPGTVGGAVRMNAGGHGRDTREVVADAHVVDLASGAATIRTWIPDDLGLGYRTSALGPYDVVVGARFTVTRGDAAACERRIADVVAWRREHQPGGANAGSVFRNPPGDSAGRLIDACGLKGLRVGGAFVSPKHANFFQAEPDATADDVHALVAQVRRRVEEQTGIRLEPELHMVGFEPEEATVGGGGA